MKITPADHWLSMCVKERAEWKCERCGTQYHYPAYGLDCSHYFSRTNKAVRHEPLNVFSHCRGCHQYLGDNPHIFREWVMNKLGIYNYDTLVEMSNDIMRGKEARHELKEIAAHYQSEYERMLQVRATGVTGRIEFVGY